MEQTVRERLGNGVVHQRERGVAADEALLGLAAEDLGEQPLRRRADPTARRSCSHPCRRTYSASGVYGESSRISHDHDPAAALPGLPRAMLSLRLCALRARRTGAFSARASSCLQLCVRCGPCMQPLIVPQPLLSVSFSSCSRAFLGTCFLCIPYSEYPR